MISVDPHARTTCSGETLWNAATASRNSVTAFLGSTALFRVASASLIAARALAEGPYAFSVLSRRIGECAASGTAKDDAAAPAAVSFRKSRREILMLY